LEVNSPRELNISGDLRQLCLEDFDGNFLMLKTAVSKELQFDCFKRFIRTRDCQSLVVKFSSSSDLVVPQMSQLFPYTDSDFVSHSVSDTDINFHKMIQKDNPNWELLGSFVGKNYRGSCFWSNINYLPKLSFPVSIFKYECLLPFSLSQTACGFYVNHIKMDPNIVYYKALSYGEDNNRNLQTVIETHNATPFPLNPRICVICNRMQYDVQSGELFQIAKPCEIESTSKMTFVDPSHIMMVKKRGKQPVLTKAYKLFVFTFNVFQRIDKEKTSFSQTFIINGGGYLKSDRLMRYSALHRNRKWAEDLYKSIAMTPKNIESSQLKALYPEEFNEAGLARLLYDLQFEKQDHYYMVTNRHMKNTFIHHTLFPTMNRTQKLEIFSDIFINFIK